MLDVAQVVGFWPFASGVAAVVDGDVAVEWWGSGLERGGWRFGQGAVVRSGSICHLPDGTSRCSKVPSTGFVVTDSCDVVAAVGVSEGDTRG